MIKINIKPLSINEAFQGRKFKTPKYNKYEKDLLLILPNKFKLPPSPYEVWYEWGVSSKLADHDNFVKCTQDILQKKYKFNDKEIYLAHIKKTIVKKGQEYIKFHFETLSQNGNFFPK